MREDDGAASRRESGIGGSSGTADAVRLGVRSTPSLAENVAARVGMTLCAKWHLDSVLGVGGMAAVYAATHRNGKRGAVKLMHKYLGPEMRQRFLREGRIANSVDHDGVVSVIDDDIAEDGSAFLVMELLDGEALSERAAKTHNKRLSVDLVLDVADQVLDALAAAHEKEIFHRDIKPGNIFLLSDGRVKLLDFGIAHLADPSSSSVTLSGIAMGTPAFMSPEQACARWDVVGPASDLWSVGATMFTLLTGAFVHEKGSFHEMLVSAVSTPARSLALALPGAPASVVALVDRALERKLADRWQDAREMQAAVRAAYHAISGEHLPVRPRRRSSTPRIRLQAPAPAPQPTSAGSISFVATKLVPPAPRWRRTAATAVAGLALVLAATATTAGWGGAQAAARQTTIARPTRIMEIASASTPTAPSAATPTALAISQNSTALPTPRRSSLRSPTPRSAASTSPTESPRSAPPPPTAPTETYPKSLFDRRR